MRMHSFTLVIVMNVLLGITGKVDETFTECQSEFYKHTPPQFVPGINNVAYICQMYDDTFYYASLYSRDHRIPIYSAYTLKVNCTGKRKDGNFFIEPQLAGNFPNLPNMDTANKVPLNQLQHSQAINADYKDSSYDRGHLNPSSYQCDNGRTATFTLTNAVPQNPAFNQGPWKIHEQSVKKTMESECTFHGAERYFVTGVIPSFNNTIKKEGQVNIPSGMWTAACCDSSGATRNEDRNNTFFFGYFGPNESDSRVVTYNNLTLFESKLREEYGFNVTVFNSGCPAQMYSFQINKSTCLVRAGFLHVVHIMSSIYVYLYL